VKEKLTDYQLLENIKKGLQAAYAELVNRHKNYAFTLANRILNNREEAEEATQDAFLKVFSAINTFNKNAKFTTWFYRIVLNEALGRKRKNKIYTEDIENNILAESVNQTSQNGMVQTEQQKYIQLAMSKLSEGDVKMITLFYLKEFSLEEIAEIAEITAETAKVKLHRARKRMAEEMKKLLKSEINSLY
jgi:RNA polymerase sigma factor (sigma-70 family)